MAAVALLAMSSCNNETDEQVSATKGKAVSFQMGLATTRTATGTDYVTTFVKGDAVGIFAYERNTDGSEGALAVTNAKYVLNEAGTSWEAADPNNTAYADTKKAYNYYAYYPYQVGATNPSSVAMTVKSDQSTAAAADYNASDALTARNKTVAMNSTNVTLQFTHAFALVQVNLEGTMADKDATVTMQNVFPGAALNLQHANGALAAGNANGTQGNIKMYSLSEVNQVADADRFLFRAIVPAQSVAANAALLEIQSKGKTYRFTYNAAVEYVAGKSRVMNVALGETSGEITITIPAADMTVDIWGTTEKGTGTGSAEEIIPLMPELTAGTQFNKYYKVANPSVANSWFMLTQSAENEIPQKTIITVTDENGTPTINYQLDATASAGWNNSAVGFTTNQCTKATYKLSFDMMVENTNKDTLNSAKKVGVSIFARSTNYKTSADCGFLILNGKFDATNSKGASLEYATLTEGGIWTPTSVTFDLSKSILGSSNGGAVAYIATSDAAIAMVHFGMTYNGTNLVHPIHIRNIKLEKTTP